jgi:hypothetical protein
LGFLGPAYSNFILLDSVVTFGLKDRVFLFLQNVCTHVTARYLKPELLLFMETHAPVSSVFFRGRIYISTALLQKIKVGVGPKGQCLAIDIS